MPQFAFHQFSAFLRCVTKRYPEKHPPLSFLARIRHFFSNIKKNIQLDLKPIFLYPHFWQNLVSLFLSALPCHLKIFSIKGLITSHYSSNVYWQIKLNLFSPLQKFFLPHVDMTQATTICCFSPYKKLFNHNIKSEGGKKLLSVVSGVSWNVYRESMLNAVRALLWWRDKKKDVWTFKIYKPLHLRQ